MMVSKQLLFHFLPFLLFLLFALASAHKFEDVTPYKEVEPPSSAPSPSMPPSASPPDSGGSAGGSSSGSGSISGSAGSDASSSSSSSTSAQASGSFSASVSGSISASASASGGINVEFEFSGSFSKVFAFGDSYTDTGNAKLLGIVKNFVGAFLARVFQGKDSFVKGSRSSNGRLVVDFLCDSLNISSLQPYKAIAGNSASDIKSGVNFAIGGATSLSGDFFANHKIGHALLWKGIPLGFQTQIEWFMSHVNEMVCKGKGEDECKQEMASNLIWLGQMGADDFARILGSSVSMRWLSEITVSQTINILKTALDRGAKFVVVQGLPPVGCFPLARILTPRFDKDDMGCCSHINKAVMEHNDLLQKALDEVRSKYPDCRIAYADYFNAYKTIMADLGGFGFSDATKTCCGHGGGILNFNLHSLCGMPGTNACDNPNSHVHWDGIHLTEAMHQQITRLFLSKGFCKPSFADLVKQHANLRR